MGIIIMAKIELTIDELDVCIDVLDASIYNNEAMMSDIQLNNYTSTLNKLKQMKNELITSDKINAPGLYERFEVGDRVYFISKTAEGRDGIESVLERKQYNKPYVVNYCPYDENVYPEYNVSGDYFHVRDLLSVDKIDEFMISYEATIDAWDEGHYDGSEVGSVLWDDLNELGMDERYVNFIKEYRDHSFDIHGFLFE